MSSEELDILHQQYSHSIDTAMPAVGLCQNVFLDEDKALSEMNLTMQNPIKSTNIKSFTLTGQFVHASQSLQGLPHRFQKALLRLLQHVPRQASPGVLSCFKNIFVFPHPYLISDSTLVLFCIFFCFVSVFGFQKRTTKLSLTLPA